MKRCRFCGKQSRNYMDRDKHGWYCRNERACFNRVWARLQAAVRRLREYERVGGQMSNVCFNLSQQTGKTMTDDCCAILRDFHRRWDEARRGLPI